MFRLKKGYVHLYTGNGRGKTTAALGFALRAAGAGLKVFIVQFAKGTATSELVSLRKLSGRIIVKQFGSRSFIKGEPSHNDRAQAAKGMAMVRRLIEKGSCDVVILDELCGACVHKLVSIDETIDMIRNKHDSVELVITGRNAQKEMIRVSDVVTEMREIKHYYTKGVKARKGIEY